MIVPSHAIVGRVIDAGAQISHYRVGDHVAVNFMVDSCQDCDHRLQHRYNLSVANCEVIHSTNALTFGGRCFRAG
ncbi:MAG: alcohol dehydrogenase catalytic domain-containing protein [Comamonas sp.]|nr:alcohol dehydrogenase catalytic domain-containing protein [Comamonas sp.]